MVLGGWVGGWVGGWWSWVKDCLQQSKKLKTMLYRSEVDDDEASLSSSDVTVDEFEE